MSRRVRLVHWKASEIRERAERLRTAGYRVSSGAFDGPAVLQAMRKSPPSAVVIDLGRSPSHGRAVALALRTDKRLRRVPIVFVGGDRDEVARIRKLLPDAVYATWRGVRGALDRAIAKPPSDPVIPASRLADYAGTPLVKKLGIRPDHVVTLIGAPRGFETTVGGLPDGAKLRRRAGTRSDLTIWFVRSRRELERRVRDVASRAGDGGLWIAWPKQASGVATDLKHAVVQEAGLGAGLTDYKICSIDDTWSGLKFARRRSG